MNAVLTYIWGAIMGIDLGAIIEVTIGSAGSAAAVYGAIRADLAKVIERATNAQESALRAHERIDGILGAHK